MALAFLLAVVRAQHPTTYAVNDLALNTQYGVTVSWLSDDANATMWFKATVAVDASDGWVAIALHPPGANSIHFPQGSGQFADIAGFGVSSDTGNPCDPTCGYDLHMAEHAADRSETQNLDNVDVSLVNGVLTARWSRAYTTGDADDHDYAPADEIILAYACHTGQDPNDGAADMFPQHVGSCYGNRGIRLDMTDDDFAVNGNSDSFEVANGAFRVSYAPNVADTGIVFDVECDTTGWVALGWGAPADSAHIDTDMIMWSVAGATVNWLDTYSTSRNRPSTDGTDNVLNTSGEEVDGVTVFSFERAYVTDDSNDVDIPEGDLKVHWAFSDTDNFADKHTDAGTLTVNFRGGAGPAPPPGPSNAGTFTSLDGSFRLQYRPSEDRSTITFTMEATTAGWAGFGFGYGDRDHQSSDFWVFSVSGDGTVTALDMWSTARVLPSADPALGGINNLQDVSASDNNGVLQVTFTRAVSTGDAADLDLIDSPIFFQFAIGADDISGTSFSQHTSAGVGSVNFFSADAVTEKAKGFELDAGNGLMFTLLVIFGIWAILRWTKKAWKWHKKRKAKKEAKLRGPVQEQPMPTPDVPETHPQNRNSCYFRGSEMVVVDPNAGWEAQDASCEPAVPQTLAPGAQVVAEYEYTANGDDELSFNAGERMSCVEVYDDGWCLCRSVVTNVVGVVPQSYVSVITPPRPPPRAPRPPPRAPPAPVPADMVMPGIGGGSQGQRQRVVFAKQDKGKLSNLWFRLNHTRIPMTDFAVLDVAVAAAYIFLNVGWVWLWADSKWEPRDEVGNLTAANSLLVALPATRNSVLGWVFGLPFDRTIMFHRWLGRFVLILSTLHFFMYLHFWDHTTGVDMNKEVGKDSNLYGLFGWIMAILILITSVAWIRRRRFSWFYWSHFLFFGYYALASLHSHKFRPYAITAAVCYGLDRLIRWFWGLYPRRTTELAVKEGNMVMVRFAKHPLARHRVGNYVFLNFPQLNVFEWHPFTLSSGPHEDTCEVHIKGLGDHTNKLIARASGRTNMWVRCDGPYGKLSLNYKRFPAIVMVGGGVGVTPLMALLKTIFHVNVSDPERAKHPVSPVIRHVFFIWVTPSEDVYGWFADAVQAALQRASTPAYPSLTTFIHVTRQDTVSDANLIPGRPDIAAHFERINADLDNAGIRRVAVYACGPQRLVSSAWDASLRHSVSQGRRYQFHHETFDF